VLELKVCLTMWEHYQRVIAELDQAIAAQLRQMRSHVYWFSENRNFAFERVARVRDCDAL
jgi:hypothetical protein